MASSSLLRQRLLCGGSLGLHLARSKERLCSATGAQWFHSQCYRSTGLPFLLGRQPRRHRAGVISMDGGASKAKRQSTAATAGGEAEPDHSLRSSIASRAGEAPAEEALEEQETEGIAEEEDYEEEVVIVQRPVRQRNGASYQASVRQEAVPSPPSSSYPGSPLFWVGVGVALAVAGSWIGGKVKEQAVNAAWKAMTSGAGNGGQPGFNPMGGPGSNPFGMPGGAGPNPFNFPGMPPMPPPPSGPQPPKATVTDTTATPVQPAPKAKQPATQAAQPAAAAKAEESTVKPKRASFRDVNQEELKIEEQKIKEEPTRANFQEAEVINEGTSTSGGAAFGSGASGSNMTVDMLEKMMDDPMVQQMVYPHLPEEMRNPETFKWMMQHPMYRQQMEEMLSNIGGNEQLMKGLDINSPEVKEQFDKIGMTPEEVVGKILSTPDVAQAFQNPRVQAAIMDVTANPMNIIKYQNDKEVMNVFDKISTLFPGMP
ncbi:chloroplast inner envelope translocon [Klebsormidium nitens]|uniref:Protein TIC 40, chloroplastic n=1 Tax=Klebsormidium nitens TaxID=105231 RepID=A0A1Y1IEM3_KLENI|nr:chloroplast inner envelope translocon [Klebsormidium nitens]|eukprot:GAQ87531.1 chloroplast inner envelope translocon [Klebsormidium nitens]